jgi:anthranilate synthase component 2
MIDNYDSFTYNIVQYFGELGAEVKVFRNDEITVEADRPDEARADRVSPGPCSPGRGRHLGGGDQGIRRQDPDPGRVPGPPEHRRRLRRQDRPRQEADARQDQPVHHLDQGVFKGCRSPLTSTATTRWPSSARACPTAWRSPPGRMTARSWACATRPWQVEGVQFHPESILTEHGHALLRNFLEQSKA